MWDFSAVFGDPDFQETLSIRRSLDGGYVGTEYIDGDVLSLEITATVVPATRDIASAVFPAQQLRVSGDGNIVEGSYIAITDADLRIQSKLLKGDKILGYHGHECEVYAVEDWSRHGFRVALLAITPEVVHG